MANEVNTETDPTDVDICRVCRCEGSTDRPLFYPCLCHGSIRYVHDDCLIQWLKISRKEECELCGTKFRFTPIYHPSMPPGRLPIKDLINGLLRTFFKALRYWLHYLIVAFCWLGVVPITASRIYRCLFAGSISSILTLPYDIVSTDHILTDVLQGGLVVFCSLGAFICLLWLREQILTGGGPAWLQPAEAENPRPAVVVPAVNIIAQIEPIDAVPLLPPPAPLAPVPAEALPIPDHAEQALPQSEHENEEAAFVDAVDDEEDDDDDDDDDDEDEDGEDEHINPIDPPAVIVGNAPNLEHNHNWIDWDRAADDLTWERLLGLDGSLQFLEHVFWVVTLNTLFILIFAYAPYHLGKVIISSKTFRQTIANTRYTTSINTLTTYGCVNAFIGYFFISFILLITFTILSFVNYLTRIRRFVGLAYIVLKVALLVILEILLFPFICGIWLDICSLRILNERTVTLNDRLIQFQMSPGTSTFLHWLCGMVFVFYFATFIFLLREVLRPGALWFLKSINDMDFNPIQEMIQLPLALHLRRFATSIIVFGCVIILMFYVPSELLIRCIPKFLPFNVKGSLETVVSELMIEFILLQGILPTLLEQGHTRTMLKYMLQLWVELASWILGLRTFLLGDAPAPSIINTPRVDQNDNVLPLPLVPAPDQAQNNQPEQIPLAQPSPSPSSSLSTFTFIEPSLFRLRLAGLCLFTCLSLTFLSILGLTIPATIGRSLLGLLTGTARLHELYTILTGLYILWLISRTIFFIRSLLPFDINNIIERLKTYSILCLRVLLCTFCVIGYVPFMIGLASELVLIIPLSTSIEQTAVLTPLRVWIIGLLNTKIAIALVMSGPQWRLKNVLERLYQDGLRRIDFSFLIIEFLLPFTLNIGMFMAFPYLGVSYLAPRLFQSSTVHQIERYIYSTIISFMLILAFVIFQIKQLRLLFEHVRDEKYLVGRRLINFER